MSVSDKEPISEAGRGADRVPSETRSTQPDRKRFIDDSSRDGAHLGLLHMERQMNVYPIVEAELRTITVMNVISGVAFSIAGLLIGFAANIWIGASFYIDLPPEAKVMVKYGAPACVLLSGIFIIGGIVAICVRSSTWKNVRRSAITEAQVRR